MRPKSYQAVEQSDPPEPSASALQAVQTALDRRDNGGGASASSDK